MTTPVILARVNLRDPAVEHNIVKQIMRIIAAAGGGNLDAIRLSHAALRGNEEAKDLFMHASQTIWSLYWSLTCLLTNYPEDGSRFRVFRQHLEIAAPAAVEVH
jgi:hypothetical protein